MHFWRAGRELMARGVCDLCWLNLYAISRPAVKRRRRTAAKIFQLTGARGGARERRDETSNSYGRLTRRHARCDATENAAEYSDREKKVEEKFNRMLKKTLFAIIACAYALFAVAHEAYAQTQADDHKFEVGAQATSIHLAPVDTTISSTPIGAFTTQGLDVTTFGIGGRVGYNVNRYVTVEAEFNYLPEKNLNETDQSRREQFFAGVKAGKRWERVGVFAKARPGVMHFDELPFHTVCGLSATSSGCTRESQTDFALDAGGVVEYYPTARTILRFDVGDTIVHFDKAGPTAGFGSVVTTPAQTTHNFQASVGFGFRF